MILKILIVLLGLIISIFGLILTTYTQNNIIGLLVMFGGMALVTEGLPN